jgi:Ca2+/Na+ antiporter
MKIKLYIVLILFSTAIFAQQNQVETKIDKTINKIGAQFNLTLKTTVDTLSTVVFPTTKNFGSLEVIRNYVIDTVRKDDKYELIKRYGLTQFDSGRFVIPKMAILINKKPIYSDSISVAVQGVVVDTLKQKMYDIKPISQVEEASDWWKYLLGVLALIAVAVLIYFLIKKYQKKKIEEETFKTPIEKATSLLNILEKKELWQHGDVKSYYSELTDIVRNYIEEALEIPAMESTTFELIAGLKATSTKKRLKLSVETIKSLESVLEKADLVKFAKSKPLDFEISEDKNKIQKSILTIDKSIPKIEELPNEDDLLNEEQRQNQIKQQLRQKRNNRIFMAVAGVTLLFVIILTYFLVTKGFTYVKDTIIGHPTKELLEGEWVKSEYGNPGISLETPKVLKRTDLTKSLPKEGLALIKDMQSFAYGSFLDNFYIMVSTINFKQETQIDLPKGLEGAIKMIEIQGGQNMIVKQEEFQTAEGIKGIKGYGTFSMIDTITKSSTKIYYEILLFSQNGGLQQFMILHEEDDQYAKQISERVMNSVELKKGN